MLGCNEKVASLQHSYGGLQHSNASLQYIHAVLLLASVLMSMGVW